MQQRKIKEKKTEVDLLKPVNLDDFKQLSEGDCFGNMWDPKDKDCSVCADIEVCGILYQDKHIKPKVKKFEEETIPLDLARFETVPWNKIKTLIQKYEKDGKPMMLDELIEIVSEQAKIKDPQTVMLYIKHILPKYGLTETWLKEIISDGKNNGVS
jgi:hypothetical protein